MPTYPPRPGKKNGIVFYDNLYGFIRLNAIEAELLETPYFQRLRWIKQLGFSDYVFPGAVHNRLTHQIGVLNVADQMIRAIGRAAPDEKLFDPKAMDVGTRYHKSIRIAAMLHDIGHFPFSHTTEAGYLLHGNAGQKVPPAKRELATSHEHLGSYIIKNTDFPGGITYVLKKHGFDYKDISRLVKGNAESPLANQILHSEVDADRMDYLVRDAYHTGIRYGHIDREFLLHHLTTYQVNGHEMLAFKENAKHAVEDLLHARWSWYSQVIKDPSSAKYDVVTAHLTRWLLEKKIIFSFQELLEMARTDPEKFFGFNDFYYMNQVQEAYHSGKAKDPKIKQLMRAILFREGPVVLRLPEFESRILPHHSPQERRTCFKKASDKIAQLEAVLKKHGDGSQWVISDLPETDVIFAKAHQSIVKKRKSENVLEETDPIKMVTKTGEPVLLVQMENSILNILSEYGNFIPSVYCNEAALKLFKDQKIL